MDGDGADARGLESVARRAARAGGTYLLERFRDGHVVGEYGRDDVKAAVDREAEARVLEVVREAFPDHAIRAEESGHHPGSDVEWVVDPLDGTNNFASGVPVFATAVAACRDDRAVAAAIHEPLPDSLYRARTGGGASVDGEPLRASSDLSLDCGTVSLVVGLQAVRDDDRMAEATRVETALRERCKRVRTTWAPCVDWGLLARGAIEGVVCLYPEVYEHRAGTLLAAESGVCSVETGPLYVGAGDAATRDDLAAVVERAR